MERVKNSYKKKKKELDVLFDDSVLKHVFHRIQQYIKKKEKTQINFRQLVLNLNLWRLISISNGKINGKFDEV